MDRGNQDVRRFVMAELDDQFREIGLVGGDSVGFEMLVETDLLRGHRLDLDDLVGAGRFDKFGHNGVGLVGICRPMHLPTARDDCSFELFEQFRQPRHDVGLDRRTRITQVFPIGKLSSHVDALGTDGVRRLADIASQLRVGQLVMCCDGEFLSTSQEPCTLGRPRREAGQTQRHSAHACTRLSTDARISAR